MKHDLLTFTQILLSAGTHFNFTKTFRMKRHVSHRLWHYVGIIFVFILSRRWLFWNSIWQQIKIKCQAKPDHSRANHHITGMSTYLIRHGFQSFYRHTPVILYTLSCIFTRTHIGLHTPAHYIHTSSTFTYIYPTHPNTHIHNRLDLSTNIDEKFPLKYSK